jgi:hypothetical protein
VLLDPVLEGVIAERPADAGDVVVLADLVAGDSADIGELPSFGSLEHPVVANLTSIAESSRRVQRSGPDWIARRATSVYTVETMPRHQLRWRHVLRIRQLLQDAYELATANRMLSALSGRAQGCWHAPLMSAEDLQSALEVPAVRGESEMRRPRARAAVLPGAQERRPGSGSTDSAGRG